MITTLLAAAVLLPQPALAGPTAQEVELARKLEKAVLQGDARGLGACIDFNAMMERATRGVGDAKMQKSFGSGVAASMPANLAAQLKKQIDEGGSYVLLRHRRVGEKQRPLLRLVSPQGLNYHELLPADAGGKYIDIHVSITGEWMSDTLRRIYVAAVAAEKGELRGREAELVESMPQVQKLQAAAREGRHAEALAIYAGLPKSVRDEKFVLIPRLQAAQNVGEKEYLAAVDDFEKAHPKDPVLVQISIDGLFLRKKYDEAIQAVDRLDEAVGGDPYLNVYRGNAHWAAGRKDKAKEAADKAIKDEPTLKEAYWARMEFALPEREHRVVADLLTVLETKLGVELGDLSAELFAEFVKSPEYAAWMKARPKKR